MRVLERLDELYAIGGGPGANRLGGSAQEDEAHALVAGWMRKAGLEVEADAAGNLFGRRPGRRPGAAEVWTGSHLDSVPQGGRFDGALGVVGGLEAVERLGVQERTLTIVAFRDEEGCRGRGCVGSRALCAAGLEPRPAAFVELHVEQGPRLETAGAPLAVVGAIAASARGEVVVEGREGHAGTTPMAGRNDAVVVAAELVLRLRDAAARVDGAVATVGRIAADPGASNVIPGRVELSVDVRAPDDARLEQVCSVVPVALSRTAAVAMDPGVTGMLRAELERQGLPVVELASGAGHDAGVLAAAGVPTAMLFVRSLNGGISHSPDEHSSPEDVELGVAVLAGALGALAAAVDD
ncbi:MAG TPA: Zn-dependent hydrolase [Gaiellaceae bacterium]|nr:Zn-dependent hydrolase [Gaiellaceae bacterium]